MSPPRKPSKAEKREAKKKEKEIRLETGRQALLDKVGAGSKKVRVEGPIPAEQKGISLLEEPDSTKSPKVNHSGDYSFSMSWCKTEADIKGQWSWGESRQWTEEEWENVILPGFSNHENETWQHICSLKVPAKGGKHIPRNKTLPVDAICSEAQKRWIELGLEQFDTTFRFRFDGTTRAWGIKKQGHFFLIWFERLHNICPSKLSNT
ncbi:hypothetical protein [Marinobacter nauticus]|uniref:hypothetical protein n=1 Tax=Marinobacter nauticus TaxID=2743 RepID=UPI001C55C361|nr:hypothetical protein [Marinobacter nauticus]MBW3198131.1 hypothetical protein [Marinobacter nauticus]MBY6183541.1 hypothetical protein [Marinobacter nauticus]